MNDALGLTPEDRAFVVSLLEKHAPQCEARVFGSRAKGTAREYSDLDIALVGDGPMDSMTLFEIRMELEESLLPFRVDVHDWRAIPESWRANIERRYVVLRAPTPAGKGGSG